MLELRGVTAGYGDTTVLRDVTVVVPEATTVALLGPNGAGKTTLLRVASGLLRPESGAVFVDGVDMTGAAPHRMASLGICHVPEGRGIFPNLTVEENLVLQARGGGVAADTALERASHAFPKLSARLRQLAGTMSGGEQQMVALARAYVQEPRVVLLDEVSMGLAPKVVDEIFRFLSLLSQEGTALVLVEQYVTRALELADYVYLLAKGIVDFAGEPAEIEGDALFASYLGVG